MESIAKSSEELKRKSDRKQVLSGVLWNAIQLVVNQSFAFIIKLVLAKLLFPAEFGVVGMATIFTGFVQILNELGIGAALIQRKDEQLTEKHFHTVFWTGLVWSILLFLIMCFVVGPFASHFYKQPILQLLIPVISVGILLSPVNLVNKAQLTKQMNFKRIAKIDNFSNIISGTLALCLAYLGAGVWSLAFNSTAIIVFSMPLYFKATGWYPKPSWDRQAFDDIFGFGIFTTGTNIVNYFINNVDYLLIGKLLDAKMLGAYTLAFVLTDTFRSRIMAVMNNVMYPVYGKHQNDLVSIKKYYLKVIEYNSVIIYPIMIFFILYGGNFVIYFFGDKWGYTITPLRILSISVMFHMMVNSNTVLIRGLGFPGLELKLQLIKAAVFIPCLILGIYYWGIDGSAWAVLINKTLAVILAQYTFNYLLNIQISTREFLKALKTPLLASMGSLVVGLTLLYFSINFVIGGLIVFSVYFGIVWLLMESEIKSLIQQIKSNRQKGS